MAERRGVKRSRYPTPEQMEAMRDADPLVQRSREAVGERAQAGGAVG